MSDVAAASSAAPTASAPSSGASSPAASSAPASPQSSPASASVTPAPPSPATAAPAPPTEQHVPYGRFKEVNDQLRSLKEQYGWVETFQKDPREHLATWMDQIASHPEWGPWLHTKAAQMLRSRRGAQQAAPGASEKPKPDVPVMDPNGNVTGYVYSDKQQDLLDEWRWQQREQALAERLAPLEQMKTDAEQAKVKAALQSQADAAAKDTLSKWRAIPIVAEHFDAIKQEFIANDTYGDNFAAAALTVLTRDVLPTRDAQTSAKVLDHLKTQAAGASVHPSASSPTAAIPRFRKKDGTPDFAAQAAWFDAHPEEALAMTAQR